MLKSLPDDTKMTLLRASMVFVQQHTTILGANFGGGDAEDNNDEDEDDEDVDEEEASQRLS